MTHIEYWLTRGRNAVVCWFAPWVAVRELKAENAKLCETISNPLLTGINIGNGTIDIGVEGGAAALMAGMFVGMFQKHPDAKNYIECTFLSGEGPILVTIVRPEGKSPNTMRREAEAARDALKVQLAAASAALPDLSDFRSHWMAWMSALVSARSRCGRRPLVLGA